MLTPASRDVNFCAPFPAHLLRARACVFVFVFVYVCVYICVLGGHPNQQNLRGTCGPRVCVLNKLCLLNQAAQPFLHVVCHKLDLVAFLFVFSSRVHGTVIELGSEPGDVVLITRSIQLELSHSIVIASCRECEVKRL